MFVFYLNFCENYFINFYYLLTPKKIIKNIETKLPSLFISISSKSLY